MKTKVPYAEALPIAIDLAADLARVCTRVEVAGSLRRRRPDCGDIEIVAQVPVEAGGLFGDEPTPLVEPVRDLLARHGKLGRNGDRYIEILDVDGSGIKADTFLVHPPADWGVIYAIRTGPADYSQMLVTKLRGRLCRCQQGRVTDEHGQHVPCPEEEDFFRAAGLEWVPPMERYG